MRHLKNLTIEETPRLAASFPFAKTCLMSGGSLTNGGDTCNLGSEASNSIFELLASIKGVPYTN